MLGGLKRLFSAGAGDPSDFRDASGQWIRLRITASDEIWLDRRLVSFDELRSELQRRVGTETVVHYERENPGQAASPLAQKVVDTICSLRLAIAFPTEANQTIAAVMRAVRDGENGPGGVEA
jgi:hypothetical protein